MGKSRRPSIKIVLTWIKQGYGQGEGKNYRPLFHVRDVPSRGRSSIDLGLKTGRLHHYLSDGEYFNHILAEFDTDVTDIREQYALLPWAETLEIAELLGIRHPTYPGTSTPILMSSDLLLTYGRKPNNKYKVISVKKFKDIDPNKKTGKERKAVQRTLEKLYIEQIYWERRGVPWELKTERDIPIIRAKNLDNLRTSMTVREQDWLNPYMRYFLLSFKKHWSPNLNLITLLKQVGGELDIDCESSFALFTRAIWLKFLNVDLDSDIIIHDMPVQLVNITESMID